ncbi:MAG: hypothetical protein AB1758_08720 [Candidatus Eremiobacterota bacterium]
MNPIAPQPSTLPERLPRRAAGVPSTADPVDSVLVSSSAPPSLAGLLRAGLAPAGMAAAVALPGPARAALLELWENPSLHQPLSRLLERGALGRTDRVGATTVENLAGLSRQAPGLAEQTARALAEPTRVSQGNRYTCAASDFEHLIALEEPADFVRLVSGLAGPEGTGVLPTGVEVQRPVDSMVEDGSGRTAVDRLVQSALMALGGMRHGSYHNLTDSFDGSQERGLGGLDVAILADLVTGSDHVLVLGDPATAETLSEALATGQRFALGMDYNGTDHVVLVHGVREGRVRFYNPQASTSEPLEGVDHRPEPDGTQSIPVADMLSRTRFAVLPEGCAVSGLPPELAIPIRVQDLVN